MLAVLLLVLIFCASSGLNKVIQAHFVSFTTYFEPGKPKEGSLEEMYQDVFMALLDSYIDAAVESYYKEYSGHSPIVDPWANKVLYIKRPNGYRTFLFEIKLEVLPYWGPHNTIGVDHITMNVSTRGVEIIGYKHIKDFPMP